LGNAFKQLMLTFRSRNACIKEHFKRSTATIAGEESNFFMIDEIL